MSIQKISPVKLTQITLTLIVNSLFLFTLSANANSADVAEKLGECTAALTKGDLNKAVKASSELLKLDPKNYDGLQCNGRALGAQGKYAEAVSALEASAANTTDGFEQIISYLFLGNLHKDNNKNAEAITAYQKSITLCELDKNDKYKRISLNLMGEAQAQSKDNNAALASYLAGYKLAMNDNERADSLERLAATYKALAQYDLAIEYQLKGVNMQKKAGTQDQYANSNLALGDIYIAAKDFANAEKTFANLAKFSNDQGGAYFEAKADLGLAQTKAASGDVTGAKVFVNKAKTIAKDTKDKALEQEIEQAIK
ncbi:MAG: tetratricopeptide repeat protein [Bdellovibrio sp.]|nr:tetratricopeptide repeat protein [Methylotenera sp.]